MIYYQNRAAYQRDENSIEQKYNRLADNWKALSILVHGKLVSLAILVSKDVFSRFVQKTESDC